MPELITNAFDFLAKGGVLMIFIFLCSIAAIVFFIERLIALQSAKRQTKALSESLLEAVRDKQFERALTLCDSHPGALSELAKAMIRNRKRTREGIQEVLADESKRQFARLNRFIPAIGVIASISPLLGLLGTVTGMIQVFSNLADEYAAGAHANPGMLAGGIWEALLTTAAGLCVAIPAFLLHRILNAKLDNLWLELEKTSTQLLDLMAPPPLNPTFAEISSETSPSQTATHLKSNSCPTHDPESNKDVQTGENLDKSPSSQGKKDIQTGEKIDKSPSSLGETE